MLMKYNLSQNNVIIQNSFHTIKMVIFCFQNETKLVHIRSTHLLYNPILLRRLQCPEPATFGVIFINS